ncbi:MAG: hypothetical protein AAB402_02000 [Patescibacteria group bacterium]
MPPKGDLQLAIGYWIVSHKQTLRKWWAVTSMAVMAFSLLWTVVFFALFFSQESKVSGLLVRAANGTGSFRAAVFKPQPLAVGPVSVIPRDKTHVDLVAELTNPNQAWEAPAVTVHFILDGAATTPQHLFVNQGDRRPVVQINATVSQAAAVKATLVVDDTAWVRAAATGRPESKFTVANITTTPSTVTIDGQTQSSVTVRADVTNASVYNYYHVEVPVVLQSGDRIVGAGQVGLDRWPTLTARPVTLTLSYPVPDVTSVRIEPQVSREDISNTYR